MKFAVRLSAVIFACSAIVFICSCEQHHVGELPPEPKLRPGQEAASRERGAPEEGRTRNLDGSPSPSITPTPAEFFPERKNP